MDVINSAKARQQVLHAQTFHGDSLLTQEDAAAAGDRRPAPDTWIYPLIQMKPFEIQIDEIVTETLLTEAERGAKVYLTTGYFNLTQAYMDLVLGTRAEYQILLASPEVNGFFGAKGVAGAIPAAYVHIERQFYGEVCSLGQQERVRLQEYWRRGWTFHAKGTRRRRGSPVGQRSALLLSWAPSRRGARAAASYLSAFRLRRFLPLCARKLKPPVAGAALLESVHATSQMGEEVRDVAFSWSSEFSRVGRALLGDGGFVRRCLFGIKQPGFQSLPRHRGSFSSV